MHYYKKNLGDYYKKAGRLTMMQHGAYTLLNDACYDRERFPTLQEAIDWVWASTKEENEALTFVLAKFFIKSSDGLYIQSRIAEEVDLYQKNSATNKRIAIERETKRKEKGTKRARSVNEPCKKHNEPPPNHKPLTINHKPLTSLKDMSTNADLCEVFDFWILTMDKSKCGLSPKRKKAITARLKDGYSVDDIKQAIIGCSLIPHNMGQNDRNTAYNDIELICRSPENLERFKEPRVKQEKNKTANQQSSESSWHLNDTGF
jgi:uncharacterized protein YdaU (DUF1376 family)